jgi:hypothetical protein
LKTKERIKGMTQSKEISDTLLVAFLSMKSFNVMPKLSNGRVTFEVTGIGINEAIETFYSNPTVPVLDFCKTYRAIRSALFNLGGK